MNKEIKKIADKLDKVESQEKTSRNEIDMDQHHDSMEEALKKQYGKGKYIYHRTPQCK